MTESMIVEAIRAAGANGLQPGQVYGPQSVAATADPSAVDRFQAAMAVDPIPFASQVSASWRAATSPESAMRPTGRPASAGWTT